MYGERDDGKWIKEGGEVAIVNTGGWNARLVGMSKIEKVLKTQIVLVNGRRFKVSDLHEHGGSKFHSNSICSPTSSLVKHIKAEAKVRDAESAARTAVEEWSKGRRSSGAIREVISEMQALLAVVTENPEG